MAKKAIVLAAGLGTRLRPLTCATPKPLMPVWGEPMLARIVGRLREMGVDDIVVNCHYLHEQVEAWVADLASREGGSLKIRASYEPEILGTGGVLNPLRDWIGADDFYLVNGDIVVENVPDFASHVSRLASSADQIGLALVTEEGPRTIEVEPESGYVTNWKSDDPGWEGTYTYCGFSLLKAGILDYVEPTGFSSIVAAYEKAMMDGKFMKVVRSDDLLWTDAGTVESFIGLNQDKDDNVFADFPQLKAALGDGVGKIEFMGARGSERVFFRSADKVVVIYDDATRKENGRYAGHAKWLAEMGIPVPKVVADLTEMKTLVLEHAGSEHKMTLEEYAKVVETLAKFNGLDASGLELEPEMDAALWAWERNLFREHCLGARYGREMSAAVEKELERVAAVLEKEPRALVHRDFQSTNVLWRNGKLAFIDFQGMRLGPAAYDLASLVYDPYVKLSDEKRRALTALYAKASGRGAEIEKVLPFAAVERLVQCLGAYGRLASVGQPQFGRHVLPALENLLDAADKAGLDAVGALAEDLIAVETKRGNGHSCSCHHEHGPDCK